MRSVLLTAAAVVAGVVVPASPASAASCVAWAEPPRAVGGQVFAEGYLSCTDPSTLTVTVCVEALRGKAWRVEACESATAYGNTVGAQVWACVQDTLLVRTFVLGSNAEGVYATATSVPQLPGIGSCGP